VLNDVFELKKGEILQYLPLSFFDARTFVKSDVTWYRSKDICVCNALFGHTLMLYNMCKIEI
jgi:hypothetical protein